MQLLRRIFDFLFWWIVLIGCVAFIGYFAWPLLSDKFYSLCSNALPGSYSRLCRANWDFRSKADTFQDAIEGKTGTFFSIGKTAVSDVLTDDGGKKKVEYIFNKETGVYEAR